MNTPELAGSHDPIVAQGWLKDMDRIFKVTSYTNKNKVVLLPM